MSTGDPMCGYCGRYLMGCHPCPCGREPSATARMFIPASPLFDDKDATIADLRQQVERLNTELSRAREVMKYLAEMYYKRVLMGFDSDYQHDEIANMLNTTAAEAVMEARKANPLAAAAVKEGTHEE